MRAMSAGANVVELGDVKALDALLAGDKAVVLDCYASWCGPCKELTPRLEAAIEEGGAKNVVLAKLDVDDPAFEEKLIELKASDGSLPRSPRARPGSPGPPPGQLQSRGTRGAHGRTHDATRPPA